MALLTILHRILPNLVYNTVLTCLCLPYLVIIKMESQPTPPRPSTPPACSDHSQHLTRDQRLQVQTLRLAGHTHKFIADLLKITERQVGYAIASEQVTPKRREGRPRTLTEAQVDELEAFVRSSRRTR
jgi:hypothetical protein